MEIVETPKRTFWQKITCSPIRKLVIPILYLAVCALQLFSFVDIEILTSGNEWTYYLEVLSGKYGLLLSITLDIVIVIAFLSVLRVIFVLSSKLSGTIFSVFLLILGSATAAVLLISQSAGNIIMLIASLAVAVLALVYEIISSKNIVANEHYRIVKKNNKKKAAIKKKKEKAKAASERRKSPQKLRSEIYSKNIEFFIYNALFTIVSIAALFVEYVVINVTCDDTVVRLSVNGLSLLQNYKDLGDIFQLMGFVEYAFLILSAAAFIMSFIALLSNSKYFRKITLFGTIVNLFSAIALSLFGKYFEMAPKMSGTSIREFIQVYLPDANIRKYVISNESLWILAAAIVIVLLMLIRIPITKAEELESEKRALDKSAVSKASVAKGSSETPQLGNPCPAFADIDSMSDAFKKQQDVRNQSAFQSLSLPGLVKYVVDYAANSRLHLSYRYEDMATFFAGLGATKLTILQGMSGTGKTSLPKIVSEAIMANCDIIEVESSWRDKNELLGYYNEFSSIYTPKKFTQAVYKAILNPETVTFIVLDEMNLSRIEYYFSDFLSLMENEEGKRQLKLLNVKLSKRVGNTRTDYKGLTDGHTLKIPSNIWFIGTANRDESTFEISDKVYDRAHTMNFNKRAKKITEYGDILDPRYVSYAQLNALLQNAVNTYKFDIEKCEELKKAEEYLLPYNISFGNRISNQIENFVKIYCSCFRKPEDHEQEAIETIFLSKVVAKLEFKSVDNKEILAGRFDKLGFRKCGDFIRNLSEE